MKKRKLYISLLLAASLLTTTGCTDFLDRNLQGSLTQEEITTPEYVDNLVIAAYAYMVTGQDMNAPFSLWPYGNVRSDDAYKGGLNSEDGSHFHFLEIGKGITTDNWAFDDIWYRFYCGVSRANAALSSLNSIDEANYPLKQARIGEMRFLRGHYLFMLKEMFKNIVIVDETIPTEQYTKISNVQYTSDEQWQKIADDFKFAFQNLPDTWIQDGQTIKGRPTRAAASAYLAKTMLYKAYRQNEKNEVTEINEDDLKAVLAYTDDAIMKAGGFSLEQDYSMNFLPQYENGRESIWAVQYSENDGTKYGNLNFGDQLTAPQGIGCCDFHKPSQNLVNAFKTSVDGFPLVGSYDTENYNSATDPVDPRLFHTVAIPGFPYKYNEKYTFDESWSRNKTFYGTYASLKENVDKDCTCLKKVGVFYANSLNHIVLRYADVLLMRAEALIELHRYQEALPLINEVRNRAAKSTVLIFDYNARFKVSPYASFTSEEMAREALQWERRLEFAMEGSRFFDLVRWGIADKVINNYYRTETARRSYYGEAVFTKNKNEYLPIPQKQINYSGNLYKQNYGW